MRMLFGNQLSQSQSNSQCNIFFLDPAVGTDRAGILTSMAGVYDHFSDTHRGTLLSCEVAGQVQAKNDQKSFQRHNCC
ncbi:hypothetical protein SDC9_67331 [bioreactor metagenome]|uniref:Uncharacterized protein n=1 Tax=bioreactor metagenome TaxID=1076179 RepID=A0A644Y302_9ZZZZ